MPEIMIIFLYGPDSFRAKEKLDEIIARYKSEKKSGLNLAYLDAEAADFTDFQARLAVSSMFAETKLLVLKNIFSNKSFQESFQEGLESFAAAKDVIVIFESNAPDQRLKLFKGLLKHAKCQEFKLLDSRGVKNWAAQKLQSMGASINQDALDLLTSYTSNDLWRLSGELQKLAAYRPGGPVKKADVELLVKPSAQTDIFKTIDALAEGNKALALSLLHKHVEAGDHPLYLLTMVAYQFRNLLAVKELAEKGLMYGSIEKKSGLHPFVVKKTYFMCRQFSFARLKEIYWKIFETDSAIKTGAAEPETALDLLVAGI
jgi:DNA polymerase-3 subunit delta